MRPLLDLERRGVRYRLRLWPNGSTQFACLCHLLYDVQAPQQLSVGIQLSSTETAEPEEPRLLEASTSHHVTRQMRCTGRMNCPIWYDCHVFQSSCIRRLPSAFSSPEYPRNVFLYGKTLSSITRRYGHNPSASLRQHASHRRPQKYYLNMSKSSRESGLLSL